MLINDELNKIIKTMELFLYKDDIKKIGHTHYNNNGFVTFVLDGTSDSFWIEMIFLRNILKLF